jgi:hypothetical protein
MTSVAAYWESFHDTNGLPNYGSQRTAGADVRGKAMFTSARRR